MGLLDRSAATSVFLPREPSGLVRADRDELVCGPPALHPGETEGVKIMNATRSRRASLAALCAALAGLALAAAGAAAAKAARRPRLRVPAPPGRDHRRLRRPRRVGRVQLAAA